MSRSRPAALAALALAAASPAAAHVPLEVGQAPAEAIHRATSRVPHGCEGAATTRLAVRLPECVTEARPMPKGGWALRIAPRTEAPAGHGAVPDAADVAWQAGSPPDGHHDGFTTRLRLAGPAGAAPPHPRGEGMRGRPQRGVGAGAGTRAADHGLPPSTPGRAPATAEPWSATMDQTHRLLRIAALARIAGRIEVRADLDALA